MCTLRMLEPPGSGCQGTCTRQGSCGERRGWAPGITPRLPDPKSHLAQMCVFPDDGSGEARAALAGRGRGAGAPPATGSWDPSRPAVQVGIDYRLFKAAASERLFWRRAPSDPEDTGRLWTDRGRGALLWLG